MRFSPIFDLIRFWAASCWEKFRSKRANTSERYYPNTESLYESKPLDLFTIVVSRSIKRNVADWAAMNWLTWEPVNLPTGEPRNKFLAQS
ncbi:hypothetical protein MC7420_4759 [Coleofasciculus chthonoplastes PCC 7420]|uniref:Uncharacterized protein n=1 Tax=Coleofasciculus chthonoplastes PCC 7420 TaxID=118168 RepID=B4VP24_9CYAN|nr:hypothetical protein [Coleofasciculus chthonoplastes]EDX76503.1 hypothetical protein MC7420_4759 [Coleofasciculus chthonoplastes PCC 7420]